MTEPAEEATRRRKHGTGGSVTVVVLCLALFLSFLQLFEPSQHKNTPSAIDNVLAGFREPQNALPAHNARDRIVMLLKEAKVLETLSTEEVQALPKWQNVVDLYGDEVVMRGLETCKKFRGSVAEADRVLGVAGLFNTGTNLLDTQFIKNLHGIKRVWQVPWGKHRMAEVKYEHTANGLDKINKDHVFPVVIIRDPLAWLQSMCAHPYSANWRHSKQHCPNFVPTDQDREQFRHLQNGFHVHVKYDTHSKYEFDSLVDLWSKWHQQYLKADYPVLFIRYEDLVFQPRAVLTEIAKCVGASLHEPLRYQINTSKNHGSGTNYVKAVTKTANADLRLHNLTQADMEYVHEHLDPKLMTMFRYHGPLDKLGSEGS